jgi:autotransporter-associated beta strand protein
MKKLLIFLAFITLQLNAQNSNLSIVSGATSGGTWSPLLSSNTTQSTYTFTPNADNATVSKTELDDLLRVKNSHVIINTACASCTQAGQIDLSVAFSTYNQNGPASSRTLTMNAGSDVNIANSMAMRSTISSDNNLGSLKLVINAVGNISVTGAINMNNPTSAYAYINATEGGSVTLNSTAGSVKVTQPINCSGTTNITLGTYSGSGGSITIKGANGVSVLSTLTSTGRLYNAGPITILDGNSTVTVGGENDGITGQIIGGAFTKSGTGTLLLSGTNNGVSSSEIIDGTLQLKGGTALPDYNTLTFTGANAVLDLNGVSESIGSIASINGIGKITSGVTGNITLTLGLSNLNTVYTGLIENGLGVLSLAKYGESLSLGNSTHSTANTYTGLTTIYAGTLAIYHSNSLGATSSGTIVRGTGKLALYNDISVGMEQLTLNTNAVSLSNESGVNAWSGSIQITQNASINATAGSLQLNQSIRGTNFSLLMSGAGAVSLRGDLTLGTGALTTSMGTFTLYSWNSYSGGTNVTAGNLVIRSTMGLGTGAVTIGINSSLVLDGGISVSNPLTLSGTGVSNTGALRSVNGNNVYNSAITLNTSDVRINSDASSQLTINGALNSTTVTLLMGGTGNLVLNGGLNGTGFYNFTWGTPPLALNLWTSLVKDGLGTLTLNSANTYTGATVISEGTLVLGASEVIPNESFFLFNGGKLSTGGFSETLGTVCNLAEGSAIELSQNTHNLRFLRKNYWDYKTIKISGWQGTAGSAGTAGRIFIGTSPIMSFSDLEQVQFSLNSVQNLGTQLSTGELVPNPVIFSGNSNVRFTTGATINGTWSPDLSSGSSNSNYVFTPSANHANVDVSDLNLILKLRYSNATIKTQCAACTQSGRMDVNTEIATFNQTGVNYNKTLTFSGNSDVTIANPISLRYPGNSVTNIGSLTLVINTAGNIYVNRPISMNVIVEGGYGSILTEGGNVYLTSTAGSVIVYGSVNASGAVNTSNAALYSGAGGTISISGATGVTVYGLLTSIGRTNKNGNLMINSGNNVVTTGYGINDGIASIMKGGNFSKLGTGTLQLSAANQIADLFLYSGTLQAGSATAIPSYSNLYFSGGNFHDGGLTATYYAFHIYENTTITLGNTAHNLTFTTYGGFTNNKMLTISTSDGSSVDAALNTFGALTTTSTSFVNLFGKKQSVMEGGMGRFGAVLNTKLGSTGAPVRFFVKYLLSDSHRAQVQFYNASQNKYYTVSQNPVAVTNGEFLPLRVK